MFEKLENECSDPLTVTMPKNKISINSLLLKLLERFPLLERFLPHTIN
jgi:hypothetical protein